MLRIRRLQTFEMNHLEMETMTNQKNRFAYVLFAAVATAFLFAASGSVAAGSAVDDENVVTLTGCLEQPEGAEHYVLKTEDGTLYALKSSTDVNLGAHKGHKVSVTGKKVEAKEKAREGSGPAAREGSGPHHGEGKAKVKHGVDVSELKHIAASC